MEPINDNKDRERVKKLLEVDTHSGQYTPFDVFDSNITRTKQNYLGEYVPDDFWKIYGKIYHSTFKPIEKIDDETLPGDRLDLNMSDLISRIFPFKPKSILEVGCGFARCLVYVEANCKDLERIEGIELSPTMVEKAKHHLTKYENGKKIKVQQGNAASLPFKDNEFDLVYTHVCLTHIPSEFIDKVTSEISRVAKDTIVHLERFRFQHEHPNPHRWSHELAPRYLKLGWKIHEYDMLSNNPDHHTTALTLRK